MKYELTQHARDVLTEREISVSWVERVLDAPERTEPDPDYPELEHHLGRIAERDDRVLRVVYNKIVQPILEVTAYFDRTMRNKL